jgi:hypothetical protein
MRTKKKKQQEPERPKTIKCPLRGHRHELPLIPHPDRPDLVIAQCNGRDVYQTSSSLKSRPVEPATNYVVPNFDKENKKGGLNALNND